MMFSTIRPFLFAVGILSIILAMALMPLENKVRAFHTPEELRMFRQHTVVGPVDSSQYFPTSAHCNGCHSTDPQGFAMVDNEGNDVNMYDDWVASMMANSAKDPFWRAKVSHETLTNPAYKIETENKCTTCHAPMGNYTAQYHGDPHYGMEELLLDSIGLDGVSCAACHQMGTTALGDLNSGLINFDTNRVQYGPYPIPFAGPMTDFVGFTPVYSEHINDAGICASCHTLITETFTLDGQPNGDTYVEQATYHEWLNSQYNVDNISCQSCHMPRILDSVVISDNFNFLQPRSPYGLHELVGGNTMMLQLMRDNRVALGIKATSEDYDATIASTFDMLQNRTLDIDLSVDDTTLDSLFLEMKLTNKAGHKFPSGYPSRRAFIELLVMSVEGDTLFHSGALDNTYEVVGHDPYYEPHHKIINDPNQVQIYEIVPADVNGNFTSLLERAAYSLKDNRLPPLGFTTSHEVYDTTLIVGHALTDNDFNYENGVEGSASDRIRYHIPRASFEGGYVNVIARVHYQSLPPKFMAEMFAASTPEIETFKSMYNEADLSTVVVGTATLDSVLLEMIVPATELEEPARVQLSPNPTYDGWVNIDLPDDDVLKLVEVYDLNGRLLKTYQTNSFTLPVQQGVYILNVTTNKGTSVNRVIRH